MTHKFACKKRGALAGAIIAMVLACVSSFAATTPVPASSTASIAPAPTMDDIRDIRGPKSIPSPWLWPAWLAGGALLTALGFAAWRWNRQRELAAKLPYEVALDQLEKARALMNPGNAREYSIAVSEIVRGYIEDRFHVWAARRTTEEFLRDLVEPSDELLGGRRALLADFLYDCDMAKFARWVFSVPEMETMHKSARTFIIETSNPIVETGKPSLAAIVPLAPVAVK